MHTVGMDNEVIPPIKLDIGDSALIIRCCVNAMVCITISISGIVIHGMVG